MARPHSSRYVGDRKENVRYEHLRLFIPRESSRKCDGLDIASISLNIAIAYNCCFALLLWRIMSPGRTIVFDEVEISDGHVISDPPLGVRVLAADAPTTNAQKHGLESGRS